jgi:cytochrome c peroxidase
MKAHEGGLLLLATLALTACGSDSTSGHPEDQSDAAADPAARWPLDARSGLRISGLPPLPDLPALPDNPVTDEKKYLGLQLFADARLSSSGTVTCGNCHSPVSSYQSNTPRDLPARSLPELTPSLPRNTPSLLNLVYAEVLHWDGSESNLYAAMTLPFAEANMNLSGGDRTDVWRIDVPAAQVELHRKLTQEIPGYIPAFEAAFETDLTDVTPEELWLFAGKALAAYITIAVSRDSAFDRWNAGEDGAISDEAVLGLGQFVDRGCIVCHGGPMMSDYQFHNLSLLDYDENGEVVDTGRYRVTGNDADYGAFLTPSLRQVNKSSPFFHDGSQAAFIRVVEHHTNGDALLDPNHDPLLDHLEPVDEAALRELTAFIKTLEGAPIDDPLIETFPDLP